jgi:hypothetical protein
MVGFFKTSLQPIPGFLAVLGFSCGNNMKNEN